VNELLASVQVSGRQKNRVQGDRSGEPQARKEGRGRPREGRVEGQVDEWKPAGKANAEAVAAMLGPTGNLRAPCLRAGKTVIVGFNEDLYEAIFG
jgi:hypothetical protein